MENKQFFLLDRLNVWRIINLKYTILKQKQVSKKYLPIEHFMKVQKINNFYAETSKIQKIKTFVSLIIYFFSNKLNSFLNTVLFHFLKNQKLHKKQEIMKKQ